MDRSDLGKSHPHVRQFVGLFDAVAYGAPLDDNKVIRGAYFDTRYSPREFAKVKQQAEALLAQPSFPVDVVADITGKHFGDADECRGWLRRMIALMEERVRAENPEGA